MDLQTRVDRLERRCRRLSWTLGLGAMGVGLAALGGASKPTAVVEARQFVVVDEDGKMRATFGHSRTGPSLLLYDADGKLRAYASVGPQGGFVGVAAPDRKATASLLTARDGSAILEISDRQGNTVGHLP
jgi:hypothetical protein